MDKFILDGQYDCLFRSHGIPIEAALRKAGLPEDIFTRKHPSMTPGQFFAFMETLGTLFDDPELPVRLATADRIETFSPPIFAAYCSRDGGVCVRRMAEYKRLVGPILYQTEEDKEGNLHVRVMAPDGKPIPEFLAKMEIVFLVHIIRSATREKVIPVRVQMRERGDVTSLEAYLGCGITHGEQDSLVLSGRDMELPFITYNEAMWDYFEPELKRRLYEMDADDSFSARVRSALTELLPGGEGNADGVAGKLGVSRRTLQRKLANEGTTFQKQLDCTREGLARHYLQNTDLPVSTIAFLLGYKELNSFQRSFSAWAGMSAGKYRRVVLENDSY